MTYHSKWQVLTYCVSCHQLLDYEERMERGGICPYCGHDSKSNICQTYHQRRYWVSERPRWWPRRLWWHLTKLPGRWEYEWDVGRCRNASNVPLGINPLPSRHDVLMERNPEEYRGLDQLREGVREAVLGWDFAKMELHVPIGDSSYEAARAVIEELTRVGWSACFGKRRKGDGSPCITIRW